MKTSLKISLIVTTYNRPKALRAVLESIANQTALPDEIIVADDGSDQRTKIVVEEFAQRSSVKVIHSWQEDCGFRASASRNKAIAMATGDYILLIDGDILLDKYYIQDYKRVIKEGVMYISSRVFLNQEVTERIENDENFTVIPSFSRKEVEKNYSNSFRITSLYRILPRITTYKRAKGYMGFWRKDCIKVNGFDENFVGWGREDSDFMIRMMNSGVVARKLKYCAISYHLWHPESPRDNERANYKMMTQTIEQKTCRCENGLDKY